MPSFGKKKLPLQAYEDTPQARGRRLLRNVLLNLRLTAGDEMAHQDAYHQYDNASCMSERLGALMAMIEHNLDKKKTAILMIFMPNLAMKIW